MKDHWPAYLIGIAAVFALFFLTDCALGTSRYEAAVVTDKEHRITTDDDGNRTHHYDLHVTGMGFDESISVSHGRYDSLKVGDKVMVTTRRGKFTGLDYRMDANKGES